MNFVLLPSLDQKFSKYFILSSGTSFLFADIIHHLFLKRLAKPASGPLYSVPAIGCEAIQLTCLRLKLLTILFISFFAEPVSVKITFFLS